MKVFIVFSLLILGTISLTNKQIIQEILDGAFQQNKLVDSETIVPCIDDKSAQQIVDFMKKSLDKAAKGSTSDLVNLIQDFKNFQNQLDPRVKQCLKGNSQVAQFWSLYGINEHTDPRVIQKKIISYLTLHYVTVHKWAVELDNNWNIGNYYKVGYDSANYAHNVFKIYLLEQKLQKLFNGLLNTNSLQHQRIITCINDVLPHKMFDLVEGFVKGYNSINEIIGQSSIDQQSLKNCVNTDRLNDKHHHLTHQLTKQQ